MNRLDVADNFETGLQVQWIDYKFQNNKNELTFQLLK